MSDADRRNGIRTEKMLTPTEFRRLRALLVFQAMLSGQRKGESQISPRAVSAEHLGHSSAETTGVYIRKSGKCSDGSHSACCFEIPDLHTAADREWTAAEPTSPFTRVHEEMGWGDALFAHLGALREQLS